MHGMAYLSNLPSTLISTSADGHTHIINKSTGTLDSTLGMHKSKFYEAVPLSGTTQDKRARNAAKINPIHKDQLDRKSHGKAEGESSGARPTGPPRKVVPNTR